MATVAAVVERPLPNTVTVTAVPQMRPITQFWGDAATPRGNAADDDGTHDHRCRVSCQPPTGPRAATEAPVPS
jgi:hypothetical protein